MNRRSRISHRIVKYTLHIAWHPLRSKYTILLCRWIFIRAQKVERLLGFNEDRLVQEETLYVVNGAN